MKPTTLFLSMSLLVSATIAAATDPALQEFAEQFAKAKAADDFDALMAMHYTEGLSDDDRSLLRKQLEMQAKYKHPGSPNPPTIEPLPEDLDGDQPIIYQGQKLELTLPKSGLIQIVYPMGKTTTPYGLKDGKPWLIGVKRIQLNYQGPPEDPYNVGVNNSSSESVTVLIEAAFRGSGVDQKLKRRFTVAPKSSHSTGLRANELLSVRISCDKPSEGMSVFLKKIVGRDTEEVIPTTSWSDDQPFVYTAPAAGR